MTPCSTPRVTRSVWSMEYSVGASRVRKKVSNSLGNRSIGSQVPAVQEKSQQLSVSAAKGPL